MNEYAQRMWQTHIGLMKKGFIFIKAVNYWRKPGIEGYRGINTKYFDKKSKMFFEVQYHTKESAHTSDAGHKWYEKERKTKSETRRAKYFKLQRALWNKVKMPPGADRLFPNDYKGNRTGVKITRRTIR